MTKEVLISIAGLQYESGDEDAIEIVSHGDYYYRNEKHYVLYEELLGEETEVVKTVKCTLKISEEQVELTKKGETSVHMIFELGKNHMTYYSTPFGDLMVGVTTKSIQLAQEDREIRLEMIYALDINYQYVADCKLNIKITAKKDSNVVIS